MSQQQKLPFSSPAWERVAHLVQLLVRGELYQMDEVIAEIIAALDAEGDTVHATLLRAAQEEEAVPEYLCQINPKGETLEEIYGHWDAHCTNPSVCAGCGGYNDYGHGGYSDSVCWRCYTFEKEHGMRGAIP